MVSALAVANPTTTFSSVTVNSCRRELHLMYDV